MATILNINQGGTNATSPAGARNSLGIKSAALKESISSSIVNNSDTIPTSNLLYDVNFNLSKITECFSNKEIGNGETGNVLSVKNGGTGVSNYTDLRNNLGIEITQLINLPIGIENGGTGASNQEDACRALLPDISGKSGNVLQVLGNNIVWSPVSTSGAVNVTKTINLTGPVTATTTSNFGEGNSIELKTSIDMDNMPIIPITHGGTGATSRENACINILPDITNISDGSVLQVKDNSISWGRPSSESHKIKNIILSGIISGSGTIDFNGSSDVGINASSLNIDEDFPIIPIEHGGTGAISQEDACKNILPSIDNKDTKEVLQIDSNHNISWGPSPHLDTNIKNIYLSGAVTGIGTINFNGSSDIDITVGSLDKQYFPDNTKKIILSGDVSGEATVNINNFKITDISINTKIESIIFSLSTNDIPDASSFDANTILFQYEVLS